MLVRRKPRLRVRRKPQTRWRVKRKEYPWCMRKFYAGALYDWLLCDQEQDHRGPCIAHALGFTVSQHIAQRRMIVRKK